MVQGPHSLSNFDDLTVGIGRLAKFSHLAVLNQLLPQTETTKRKDLTGLNNF